MAVTEGHIKKLIINIPPRHMKSLTVSVLWPSWEWIRHPEIKSLTVAYGRTLATRDARKTRQVIQSKWYQERWGERFRLLLDQNVKSYYENDKGGIRIAGSFESGVTGEGGGRVNIDDPTELKNARNARALESAIDTYVEELASRLNDPVESAQVLIMQRLNDNDLTGYLLREQVGQWVHLFLPQKYEPDRKCVTFFHRTINEVKTPVMFEDPRTEPGELLHPNRFPKEVVDQMEKGDPFIWSGQQQQRPTVKGGEIFHEEWFETNYYRVLPNNLDFSWESCQSWDMTFKDTKHSDYVCGTVWVRQGADIYLLYRKKEKLNFPKTVKAIREVTALFPQVGPKLIEDKANGPAIISTLKREIMGMLARDPGTGGVEALAQATSYMVEAGNVHLPHPSIAPWVTDLVKELTKYPRAQYDDQVSSCVQAWYWYHERPAMAMNRNDILSEGEHEPVTHFMGRKIF